MASTHNNIVKLNCEIIPQAAYILRSLFRSIWKKTTGKRWKNTLEDGNDFIASCGKSIWMSATFRQKYLLESGNVDLWDLKLLNHVLPRLKLKHSEKDEIRSFCDACNDVSRDNESLTNDELIRIEEMTKNLNNLASDVTVHLDRLALEDLCEEGLNDLVAEDFRKAATAYSGRQKYSAAIDAYTDAIKLTKLSNKELGELYYSRSEMFLKQTATEDKQLTVFKAQPNTKLSLEDAKRAVVLIPGCPEAHFHLACAYFALNKFNKALKWLNIARELGKQSSEVAEMRKECEKRVADLKMEGAAACNVENLPKNNAELVDVINKRTGSNASAEKLLKMEKMFKGMNDPNAKVWKAHRWMLGFNCEQNCKLGVQLFEEAAQQGNAEAMYNLGIMYREGKHVEKDLKKSLTFLEKAAESKNPKIVGLNQIGVSEAQFELGFLHQKGISLSRDNERAVQLFTKSSENGNRDAARTLGQFYFNGNRVEKDVEKAIQFWNLAAKRYDVMAMQILAEYYLDYDLDPDQALKWHYQAVEAGNLIAKEQSEEFIKMTLKIKKEMSSVDEDMIRWEKKNGFFGLGETINKRMRRYMEHKLPGVTKFSECKSEMGKQRLPIGVRTPETRELSLELIEEFIAKGGIYAREIKKAFLHFENGKNYLTSLDGSCWRIIVHEFAEALRITEKIVSWDSLTHLRATKLVSWAMSLKDNSEQIDKDLRVCYVIFNMNSLDLVMKVLEESVKLYPNDIWFLQPLCGLHGFMRAHERGVQIAEEGLAREPNNIELLFLHTTHLRKLDTRDRRKVIKAQEKFLASAPPDHCKVPDVYYALALEHRKTFDLAAKYYYLGLEAEKKQMPFFLVGDSDMKKILEQMMSLKPFRLAFERQQILGGGIKLDQEKKGGKEEKDERNDGIDAARLKIVTNPRREVIIRDHRHLIKTTKRQIDACKRVPAIKFIKNTVQPKLKQKAPPQLAEVKTISLQEMDPFKEQVYVGFELKCVVIDEPSLGFTGVGIIVEDENGDVERVSVYNIEQDEEVHDKIGYGCQITILNPYFKIAADQKQLIRVDDLESVIFDAGPDLSRCRYCGKSGAVRKCARCLKACYCSKECQEGDWKILKHKFVCIKI